MLIVTPKIDLNGERWFSPTKAEDSERQFSAEEESLFKLRLLVASSENRNIAPVTRWCAATSIRWTQDIR